MIENPDQIMKVISIGVYVIGVRDGERQNAFTASWVTQISFDPVLLVIAVNPKNYSYDLLKASGICTVNVLSDKQIKIAGHFGNSFQSLPDKMAGYIWRSDATRPPILEESLAYFDCNVIHWVAADTGSHKLAVCEVAAAAQRNSGIPLLYTQTGALDGSSELYDT
ncbi:MAG: flavin reductase family protein [Acidobacteria bacterium]|nr:flavin reductase family protein [Acidobacteriota bacterium]